MVISRSLKKIVLLCFALSALAMPVQSNAGLWDTFTNFYAKCFETNKPATLIGTIIAGVAIGFGIEKLIGYFSSCRKKGPKKDQPQRRSSTSSLTQNNPPKNAGAPPAHHGISIPAMDTIQKLEKALADLDQKIVGETGSPFQMSSEHLKPKTEKWLTELRTILSQVESMQQRIAPIKPKLAHVFDGIQRIISNLNIDGCKDIFALFQIVPGFETPQLINAALDRWHEGMQRNATPHAAQFADILKDLIQKTIQNQIDVENYKAFIKNEAARLEITDASYIARLTALNGKSQSLNTRIQTIQSQNRELLAQIAQAQQSSADLRQAVAPNALASSGLLDPLRDDTPRNALSSSGTLPPPPSPVHGAQPVSNLVAEVD